MTSVVMKSKNMLKIAKPAKFAWPRYGAPLNCANKWSPRHPFHHQFHIA